MATIFDDMLDDINRKRKKQRNGSIKGAFRTTQKEFREYKPAKATVSKRIMVERVKSDHPLKQKNGDNPQKSGERKNGYDSSALISNIAGENIIGSLNLKQVKRFFDRLLMSNRVEALGSKIHFETSEGAETEELGRYFSTEQTDDFKLVISDPRTLAKFLWQFISPEELTVSYDIAELIHQSGINPYQRKVDIQELLKGLGAEAKDQIETWNDLSCKEYPPNFSVDVKIVKSASGKIAFTGLQPESLSTREVRSVPLILSQVAA